MLPPFPEASENYRCFNVIRGFHGRNMWNPKPMPAWVERLKKVPKQKPVAPIKP